jgi:hypothetical protein
MLQTPPTPFARPRHHFGQQMTKPARLISPVERYATQKNNLVVKGVPAQYCQRLGLNPPCFG